MAARLDVVVVARDAGCVQAAQLRARQQAVRGAEVDVAGRAHALVGLDGPVEVAARKRAARGHDGEAVGTGRLVGACVREDRLLGQEAVLLDARVVAGRLRAVLAVLAAVAAAPVDDRAEVDGFAAEVVLQQAGALLQLGERRLEEQREVIPALDAVARNDFLGQ